MSPLEPAEPIAPIYRIEPQLSLAEAVRRIVAEQTRFADDLMHDRVANFHRWVHVSRTCGKKLRSLLRLLEPGFDADHYREEMTRIRDFGRCLADYRDAAVMIQTLDGMLLESAAPATLAESGLREHLSAHLEAMMHDLPKAHRTMDDVASDLDRLRSSSAAWRLSHEDMDLVAQWLRGYRKARRMFLSALGGDDDEAYHEWRKQVKNHWYQCRLLEAQHPRLLNRRLIDLKALSEYLGSEHDLAVLRQFMHAIPASGELDFSALDARLLARQMQFRELAQQAGAALFTQRPRDMAAELLEQRTG